MTSILQIKDLSLAKELDRKALADVRGGASNEISFGDFKQKNESGEGFPGLNSNSATFAPFQLNLENVGNSGYGYYPYYPWYA